MATTVETRPEWLPDEYEHVEVTREEVRQALDREARRLFNSDGRGVPRDLPRSPGAVPRQPGVSLPDLSRLPHCRAKRDLAVGSNHATRYVPKDPLES